MYKTLYKPFTHVYQLYCIKCTKHKNTAVSQKLGS